MREGSLTSLEKGVLFQKGSSMNPRNKMGVLLWFLYMGGCQNDGLFLGTLHIRCRMLIGYPKRYHNFDNHSYVYVCTS